MNVPPPAADDRSPYRWAMLGGVWLAYFCFGLTYVTLAPLVSSVTADLGMNRAQMGTVLGAWQLVYIATALPCGLLLDRIGPRRALALAFLVIAASGALRALAQGHLSLFLAVAVFGLGGPLVSIGAPKVISQWFEGRERGLAMGVYITGASLGNMTTLSLTNSVLMPMMDGAWRSVILVYAGFVVAAALVWLGVTAHPSARAVEAGAKAAPRESQLAVFAALIRAPAVRVLLAMAIGIFFINHAIGNWLPEILRAKGMPAATAGFWASVPTLIGIGSALVVPRLATPPRRLALLGGLIASALAGTMLMRAGPGGLLFAGLIASGLATGGMMTLAVLTLIETPEVGPRRAGMAGGMFFAAAEVGGVLGPVSVGVVAETVGGFGAPLGMLSGMAVVLLLLLLRLRSLTARAKPGRN